MKQSSKLATIRHESSKSKQPLSFVHMAFARMVESKEQQIVDKHTLSLVCFPVPIVVGGENNMSSQAHAQERAHIYQSQPNRSVLADLVSECYIFLQNGKNPQMYFTSPVQGYEVIPATEFLKSFGSNAIQRKALVQGTHLPLDPCVYAIALSGGRVRLETAKADLESLATRLQDRKFNNRLSIKGASAFLDAEQEIIKTITRKPFNRSHQRTLWRLPEATYKYLPGIATLVIGELDNGNCHNLTKLPEVLQAYVGTVPQSMHQRQEMVQCIEQHQRPDLLLDIATSPYVIEQGKILKMTTPEVKAEVRKHTDEGVLEIVA